MTAPDVKVNVLELYAGIGGMHFALRGSGIQFEVVQAMEINPLVLQTYNHCFPDKCALPRNIESLSAKEINDLEIDLILMSPPCQPFCRTGRMLDIEDTRSSSFAHLLSILPEANFKYLLLENVKGFEVSEARDYLLKTLEKCGMAWQEFLLNPHSLGVPNSRLRYYLLAKKCDLDWSFQRSSTLMTTVPMWDSPSESPYSSVVDNHRHQWEKYREKNTGSKAYDGDESSWCIADILERSNEMKAYLIPLKLVSKYGIAMDIVTSSSRRTNCFTKGYGSYVKGTGSYIAQENFENVGEDDPSSSTSNVSDKLLKMKLRYFTPREVARLMCFPEDFKFPPSLSTKQRYRALGNSINVYVVSILISLLLNGPRK